ncbi:urease accessory protein UreD [Marinobacter sp. CHS3-4]|uniref:urease accessory protein UreD n=1 Tax=Marinobacter sp. CHS3-4 TaxID=3045174 RepID=UPI0024B60B69|nr:urease accessory protein UreD [Marinobacter sp. CHS3-4]MDI9244582.1 urease accessory protein UreD [Marinobacter sp. CHS3-4]
MTVFERLPTPPLPKEDSGHRFDADRRWAASIQLGFEAREEQTKQITRMTRISHKGPLRVQRPFYPEGKTGCCHVYLLHPPGGLVSGDSLGIDVSVGAGAHSLLTTPAAAKLYKADRNGVAWGQHTSLNVAKDGVLEYLPQETLAFNGSRGEQTTTIELESGAKCIGWEVLALGRPVGDLPFVTGHLEQRFSLSLDGKPLWLERQILDPTHPRFQGKWGQGGATVQATLWVVGLEDEAGAIEAIREQLPESKNWAVTRRRGVVLLRYLGNERNEAWKTCQSAWEILRPLLTGHSAVVPRIWLT